MKGSTTMYRSGEVGRALVLSVLLAQPLHMAWAADETAAGEAGSLTEVVVTATHREENVKDVPESISVVDNNLLQSLGTSGEDIKQLAFKVPSLNIESSNGRAFPRL